MLTPADLMADAQFDLDDGITQTLMDGFIHAQKGAAITACKRPDSALNRANFTGYVARHDVMG